jgi:2-(1,2-epoxy-1,2-dihydrophenyl)acetyl-CoA isomerase
VIVIRFKGNPLLNSAIFKNRNSVLDYFNLVSSSDAIQVIVLLNRSKRSPRETYCEFYKMIFSTQYWENSVLKMYRTFGQIVLRIVESDKFFISADNGNIIPQIFNVSLACDYRIISSDAVFENAPLELGLMPKGGGVFFSVGCWVP